MIGVRLTALLGLGMLALLIASLAAAATTPQAGALTITPVSPQPGSQIGSQTPTIAATFTDSGGAAVDPGTVILQIDGSNYTGIQGYNVSSSGVSLVIPTILKLTNGNHSVTITATDTHGARATASWGFDVNTSLAGISTGGLGVNPLVLVTDIIMGAVVCGAAFGGYYLYLRRTRKFTFHKYFLRHPVNKRYLVLVIPGIAALVFALIALTYVLRTPGLPLLAPEYVICIALFIGLTAYAIDSRRELQRMRAFERAFAQFLFEMADAMRGGLDPAKALTELAGTHTNILRKPLRVAADGIRVGRPFDSVMRSMVSSMRSPLIQRYAELIADASSMGGETAAVIHRAAKDMDDFIKIEQERVGALALPVAVLYVSYGVLLAVLFSLLSIAPSLGGVSLSFIGGGGNPLSSSGGSAAAAIVPKLTATTLVVRFADLMLINGLGTGFIIGAFTEGKAKYGLLHSLALVGITAFAFAFFAP